LQIKHVNELDKITAVRLTGSGERRSPSPRWGEGNVADFLDRNSLTRPLRGRPLPVGERWSLPMRCSATSRPFCPGLGREIDRALAADIIEMRVEEVARRPPSTVAQHHEELVIRVQLAVGRELAERVVERDAVQLDAAVLAGPGAVRQPAFV